MKMDRFNAQDDIMLEVHEIPFGKTLSTSVTNSNEWTIILVRDDTEEARKDNKEVWIVRKSPISHIIMLCGFASNSLFVE